jgi:GNAT superfamily N-acetyltransferase
MTKPGASGKLKRGPVNVAKALAEGAWVAAAEIRRIRRKAVGPGGVGGDSNIDKLDDSDIERLVVLLRALAAIKNDVRESIMELDGEKLPELTDDRILEMLAKERGLEPPPRSRAARTGPSSLRRRASEQLPGPDDRPHPLRLAAAGLRDPPDAMAGPAAPVVLAPTLGALLPRLEGPDRVTLECVVRPLVEGDKPLVFSSWTKCAFEAHPANMIARARFIPHQHEHVARCLARGTTLVAAHPDDQDALLGFLCYEVRPPDVLVVHWAYVKRLFRRRGVGRRLIEEARPGAPREPILFTQPSKHLPWLQKRLILGFDPYILEEG